MQCRSWRYARRASLDLAGLLALARKRRLVDASRAIRAANCAMAGPSPEPGAAWSAAIRRLAAALPSEPSPTALAALLLDS